MMWRAISNLAVALLLAAALFIPTLFLRPVGEAQDAGAATPPPDSTAVAGVAPSPPSADTDPSCGSATVSYDAAVPTIANRAEGASVVAIATVKSVGAARWNTDDGIAPAFDENPPADAYIYRPVSLSLTSLARGDVLGAKFEVNALGGTVGCYSFQFEDSPELQVGQQYAFFLAPALTQDGKMDPSRLNINAAWSVTADRIATPLEGKVAIAVFLAAVEAAPIGPFGEAPY